MASTIQVDKIQDTGGNTILSSNSTGTFTYEAASGANFTALDADNVSAGTLAIARGGTGAATLAGAGLSMTPSFCAKPSASQTIAYNTTTKLVYDSEIWDTNAAYDPTTYAFTVPVGEAGKYYISGQFTVASGTDTPSFELRIEVNADTNPDFGWGSSPNDSYNTINATCILDLSAGDVVDMWVKQNHIDTTFDIFYSSQGHFQGYKLVGV